MGGLALGLAIALGLAVGIAATFARRNRVLLRLGLRNATRRRGRAALIVAGLMLGTTIIASALTTGDTMNRTVRSAVIESLGRTDELVSVKGTERSPALELGTASSVDYFRQDDVPAVEHALRDTGLVDGVAPAIIGAVIARASASLAPLGLELQDVKRDGLKLADQQGDVFVSIFTTFGSFSIAAGILLIFLIFVMLSAEHRSELGIARAIGTRREHLVQMFVFEGVAYDLGAALVGAALGVGVAFAMVSVMADAFTTTGLDVQYSVTLRSLVVAYALGVLLTLVVVAVSAWRVSRLTSWRRSGTSRTRRSAAAPAAASPWERAASRSAP